MGTSSCSGSGSSGRPYRVLLAGEFRGELEHRRIEKQLWDNTVSTTAIGLGNPQERFEVGRLQKAVSHADVLVLDASVADSLDYALALGEALRCGVPTILHCVDDMVESTTVLGYRVADRISFGVCDLVRKIEDLLPPS